MLVRALGIGLLAIIAIPLVVAYPPLALLGLGGWLVISRRPGRRPRKRGGQAASRARSPRTARRRPNTGINLRLGRSLLWIGGVIGLIAVGPALAREAPGALAALVLLGLAVLFWTRAGGRGRGAPSTVTAPIGRSSRERSIAAGSGTEFERYVVNLLEGMSYRNVRHVGGPGDRGVDIIARDSRGRTFLVQCKRFTGGAKVGSVDIQKLIGAVVHLGADGGIFVTTSHFTPAAVELARGGRVPIALYDGNDVARLSRRLSW